MEVCTTVAGEGEAVPYRGGRSCEYCHRHPLRSEGRSLQPGSGAGMRSEGQTDRVTLAQPKRGWGMLDLYFISFNPFFCGEGGWAGSIGHHLLSGLHAGGEPQHKGPDPGDVPINVSPISQGHC
ncbi:serine/threonine-protein phosphatase 4 regulatory subunit 2 [Platysternon megacephalum]|uniref:Serine/threonine-protein phosphatase 4 regulatory subunit 2 n=1 Tax=Platysternon megacephalum TaxID=55544 RepID=A0A4D9ELJ3_9SAUR|nr:serine/threonine-protein phosphatase 4 regulatory subunit 2 [Platysternon megacephalum]